jgi:hypothetical protein
VIGRVISLRRPNGLLNAGTSIGTILDLANWRHPQQYTFTGNSNFGVGSQVGFDLATSPIGVQYAVNLRVPTADDLALLP